MNTRVALALLVAGLTTGTLAADDVVLTNGETFEGVIAEHEGDHVRIRLEFGELRLPASSVARIEDSRSALSDYLARRRALVARSGSAAEWLELARWARSRGLDHSHREALLEAAALDPHLDGLEPAMRLLGYVFDEELDLWIPYEEKMRRAGLVRAGTGWVRPAETRPEPEERDRVEETLSRTVEILALAELERETRESRESRSTAATGAIPYGFPVAHFGGYFVAAPTPVPGSDAGPAPSAPALPEDLFRRPPGSLLPVGGAGNHGVRLRQPGSLIPTVSGR